MSWTQKSHRWDRKRLIRILRLTGHASLVLGAALFIAAVAMPTMPAALYGIGIMGLVIGLALHCAAALDRWVSLPRRHYVRDDPPAYRCHSCGYELRGLHGVYCPECGAVRPAPLDDQEAM